MVGVALAVGAGCGLVNGLLIAYGRIVPFITTLAMLASARGLAEIISDRKTQIVKRRRLRRLLQRGDPRHPRAGLDLRAGRGRRLGPAQPHDVRPPYRRRRRQPRGRPPGRHQRQAAHRLPLRARRRLLRHRRADAGRPDHDRQRRPTAPLRARRDRRGRHRRHPAHRWPRHHRRHRPRRPDLHDAQQRLHPQQPLHLGAGSSSRESSSSPPCCSSSGWRLGTAAPSASAHRTTSTTQHHLRTTPLHHQGAAP